MRVNFNPVALQGGGNIGGLLNQANNSFTSSFDRLAANLSGLDNKRKQSASNQLIPQLAGITTQEQADAFLSNVDPRNITPELATQLVGLKSNAQNFQTNALKQDGIRANTGLTQAQTGVQNQTASNLASADGRVQETHDRAIGFEDALNRLAPQVLGSSLDAADGINGSGTNALRNLDTSGANITDLLKLVDGNQGREQLGNSNRDTTRANQQTFDNTNSVNADANRSRDFNFGVNQREDDLKVSDREQARLGQSAAFDLNATSIDAAEAQRAFLNDPNNTPEAKAAFTAQLATIPEGASAPSFESNFANTGLAGTLQAAAINTASVTDREAAAASNDTFRRVANRISQTYSDDNPGVTFKERNPDVAKSKDVTGIVNQLSRSENVSPATVYAAIEENFREHRSPFNTSQTFDKKTVRDFIRNFNGSEDASIAAQAQRASELTVSSAQGLEQSLIALSDRIRRAEDLGRDTSNLRALFAEQRGLLNNR